MPEVKHLCPACKDDASEARSVVFKVMGCSVALTPLVLLFLIFAATAYDVKMVIDDRILLALLAAYAAVIAALFKK